MASPTSFQAFTLFFILILLSRCHGLLLDVHLSLRTVQNDTIDMCPYSMALESNLALRQLSVKEEIDFFMLHTPHITLYQADFDIGNNTQAFVNATASAMSNQTRPCHITWPPSNNTIVSHDYAMYPISNTPCLQRLSKLIVEALKGHIHQPPPVPEWVYSLPPEQQRRALALIQKYGSPNVFERFQPHVTVGYDTVYPPVRRKQALDLLTTPQNCQASLAVVWIARVGVGGSVLQNGVIGKIPLYIKPEPNITVKFEKG